MFFGEIINSNSINMLTSSNPSNQYLRPDYLQPLPSTLDAKNSPLALLAQTCSSIGADSPNPKLLANIEKSTKSHKSSSDSRDKSSPGSQSSMSNSSSSDIPKSSFKPYEMSAREKNTITPEERSSSSSATTTPTTGNHRTKTPKSMSQLHHQQQQQQDRHQQQMNGGRCGSNHSAASPRSSPSSASIITNNNNNNSNHNNNMRKTPNLYNPEKSTSPQRASSKESSNNAINASLESPHSIASKLSDTSSSSVKDFSIASIAASKSQSQSSSASSQSVSSMLGIPVTSAASAFLSGYPTSGLPYPMDLMTASALMSPHHSMLKAAALSPYFNYARMKVPGSNDPMMSICRDPYCTGCALSPHMMGKSGSSCPAGCTQCDHPGSKGYSSALSAAHNSAAAAYAHAQLAALAAASQLPFVCNWIAGDAAYCGKRFSTSEELLQHLRTHTSSMSESMLNPAVAAAAAAAGLPPTHPLFQRTYPTPPLSPLSTARYHPYSKPSLMPPSLPPPSLAGLQMQPHPSLAQYFSPYSLYGPRLGAPPSMHP